MPAKETTTQAHLTQPPDPLSRTGDDPSRTTDAYGAQVTVSDGIPSFTLVGHTDGEQQTIREMLQRSLAGLWPQRRITVAVPADWRPSHDTIMALARAIHFEHACGQQTAPPELQLAALSTQTKLLARGAPRASSPQRKESPVSITGNPNTAADGARYGRRDG